MTDARRVPRFALASTLPVLRSPVVRAEGRACGDCRLCCRVMEIEELNKPRGEWCEHACSRGCAIYADRPPSCAGWSCLWLAGAFEDRDRPDRLRLVPSEVELDGKAGEAEDPRTGRRWPVITAHEAHAGAALLPAAQDWIARCRASGIAVAVASPEQIHTVYLPSGISLKIPRGHPDGRLG